jgi:hypothetical protein
MSANGAFSTTLDYQFFGGGYSRVSGEVSGLIETSLIFDAQVPITGEISNFNLDFSFVAGVETPTIYGNADLSFGFVASGQAEQGIQTFGKSEWINRLPFEASSEGYVVVSGNLNQTLEFNLDTNIFLFSDGDGAGSFGFSLASKGTNVSTGIYHREGANYCTLDGSDYNSVQILLSYNDLHLVDSGIRQAEIITAFNK